jgi:hypothetical protein
MLPREHGDILLRVVMKFTVGEEYAARHIRVVSGMTSGPGEEPAAYDVTQAVGICDAYLGMALEFESGPKGVAGVEAEQGADNFGLAWGEGRLERHYEVAMDKKVWRRVIGDQFRDGGL